ncbi:MAG: hypothetical protein WAW88_16915 [Nocardioides sp.]
MYPRGRRVLLVGVKEISLAELTQMWNRWDPPPDDLVERILLGLAWERSAVDLDAEWELLSLVSRTAGLVGARSNDDCLTLYFEGTDLAMVLRVSRVGTDSCRIDGWVDPPQPLTITAVRGEQRWPADTRSAESTGRFELTAVPLGPTTFELSQPRTEIQAPGGAEPRPDFVTEAIDL